MFEPTTQKPPRPGTSERSAQRVAEPAALDFSTKAREHKVAPTRAAPLDSGAPAPLDFAAVTPRTVAPLPTPGGLAFTDPPHKALVSALAAAKQLAPQLSTSDEALVSRYLAQGLPVSLESLDHFAETLLNRSREQAETVASMTTQLSRLRAPELLARVTEACQAKSGLFDRLKAKLNGPEDLRPGLTLLRQDLQGLSEAAKTLIPQCATSAQRLTLALLALRSIERVSSGQASTLRDCLQHRLDLPRVAATQAGLADQQLAQLHMTVIALLAKSTQLLTVTLSANQLATR